MNSKELFTQALQIAEPWYIEKIEYEMPTQNGFGQMDIYINFRKGGTFRDSEGNLCKAYDTSDRKWKHLNFFQSTCYIHARVPRINSKIDGIVTIDVPWARSGSGFTLLFEAFAMMLIEKEMPVKNASEVIKVTDKRLWRVFKHYVEKAISQEDHSEVTAIGVDETSFKKGHKYVTVAVDMNTKKVIHATEGKSSDTMHSISKELKSKGGSPANINEISIDMSKAFIAGAREHFPQAAITFDKFHIVKMINEAVDEVRKKERRENEALKGYKYLFLKSDTKLKKDDIELRHDLMLTYPGLAKAVSLRELFNDFWAMSDIEESQGFLQYWCDLAEESGVLPFKELSTTIKMHWYGIVNYLKSKLTNGILEGINSKIQLAKKRARGFRNINNFINMIYFIAGNLKFDYPHYSS